MDKARLAKQLIDDEGLRLKPYRCTKGKLTIGVGRNLESRGITQAEAMGLLDNDIQHFWGLLIGKLPWVINAPETIQDVLVNMAFNMGIGGLLEFTKTLPLLQAGRYLEAADEMLRSDWSDDVGGRARRLADMVRSCAKEPA